MEVDGEGGGEADEDSDLEDEPKDQLAESGDEDLCDTESGDGDLGDTDDGDLFQNCDTNTHNDEKQLVGTIYIRICVCIFEIRW